VVSALSFGNFDVTTAETFEQAREVLARRPPDLLVTAIRLGEYNGLHLVLRGKAARPRMAAVVTSPIHDSVLSAEAQSMQTTFVVTPTTEAEMRAAVLRTIHRTPDCVDAIRAPFERRRQERRVESATAYADAERRLHGDRRRGRPSSVAIALGS
jgi:DNA-binding NtrC family response regulator